MSSVLNSLIKLPRYVRILSTNGIDENNAIVLETEKEKERKHAYYERNKEKIKQYYKERYLLKRKQILEQKKIRNQIPEIKERNRQYHKKYYQDHKEEFKIRNKQRSNSSKK